MTISTTPLPVTTEAEVASSPAKRSRFWAWLILILGAVYFLVPLGATFYWSLRAEKDVLGFEAYRRLFADSNFWPSFTESVVNAVAAILLSLAPLFFPIVMQALGLLTGMIQAYIFAILAMVYIASATRAHHDAGHTQQDDQNR